MANIILEMKFLHDVISYVDAFFNSLVINEQFLDLISSFIFKPWFCEGLSHFDGGIMNTLNRFAIFEKYWARFQQFKIKLIPK